MLGHFTLSQQCHGHLADMCKPLKREMETWGRRETESNNGSKNGKKKGKAKTTERMREREGERERNPFWNAFHYDLGIENGN